MYADQESGLGPDVAKMDAWPGDWKAGKWIDHVDVWQRAGRPGHKPPGVSNLAPPVKSGKTKDYQIQSNIYLSRPEVRVSIICLMPFVC
jgi:mannosyl-oligosaccharide alpha-1,2-mannosidase